MPLFTLDELAAAATIVRSVVPPTPAYAWPLLAKRIGAEVVVKHENHTPIGAFHGNGMTWERITRLANDWLPKPLILHSWPQARFTVTHPRWEPYAGIPLVRICAGGAQQ